MLTAQAALTSSPLKWTLPPFTVVVAAFEEAATSPNVAISAQAIFTYFHEFSLIHLIIHGEETTRK